MPVIGVLNLQRCKMSVTVQLFSGDACSYNIRKHPPIYKIHDLIDRFQTDLGKSEVKSIVLSKKGEDGEFSQCDRYDVIHDDDYFYAFVDFHPKPVDLFLTFDDTLMIVDSDGMVYRRYGYDYGQNGEGDMIIPKRVNMTIQLTQEAYDVMMVDIRRKLGHEIVKYDLSTNNLKLAHYSRLFINLQTQILSYKNEDF